MADAKPLTTAQKLALQVAYEFGPETGRVVLADRSTLNALVRRGLAHSVRREDGCWIATMTDDGYEAGHRLADAQHIAEAAEQVLRDASPEGQLARRWMDSIGGSATARVTRDGHVRLTLHLAFGSVAVCDKFRLDIMGVLLDYRRRTQQE